MHRAAVAKQFSANCISNLRHFQQQQQPQHQLISFFANCKFQNSSFASIIITSFLFDLVYGRRFRLCTLIICDDLTKTKTNKQFSVQRPQVTFQIVPHVGSYRCIRCIFRILKFCWFTLLITVFRSLVYCYFIYGQSLTTKSFSVFLYFDLRRIRLEIYN